MGTPASLWRIAAATVAAASLGLAPSRSASDQQTLPPVVERTIAAYTANVKGIIGMERHFETSINGGIVHHSEQSDSGFVMRDGAFMKIKYYRITDDGKAFSQKQLDQRDSDTNQSWGQGKVFFKEPYDPRFSGDYRFQPATACATCANGIVAVAFTSSVKDTQHGNGTMWIEEASGRVDKLTYVPNVMPPHATSGSVTESSGQALSDLWYVIRIDETYNGHALMLRGSATFVGIFDHFQRFTTPGDAEVALESGLGR